VNFAKVSTWVVALAWTVIYAAGRLAAHRVPDPGALVVPPLLWVALLQIDATFGAARSSLRRGS
jgi:hypothetical protein